MKNKFKNWWNKPITNGAIVSGVLIETLGCAAIGGAMYLYHIHQRKSLYNGCEENGEIDSENI